MNYRKYAYSTIAGTLLLAACQSAEEKQIVGKWRAVKLVECAEVKSVDMRNVYLEFGTNGQYTFNSTFNTPETGQFKLKNAYLFLKRQDISKNNSKTLLIKSLSKDSLVLEMNNKGLEQFLTLVRYDAPLPE